MSQSETVRSTGNTQAIGGEKTGGSPGAQPMGEDSTTPGNQERPLTEDEALDEALEETFPTSDPISPSRIDGPNN